MKRSPGNPRAPGARGAPTALGTASASITLSAVLLTLAVAAHAQGADSLRGGASVTPGIAKIGERVIYRGTVVSEDGSGFQWLPPESAPDLTWGTPRFGKILGRPLPQRFGNDARVPRTPGMADTFWVEVPLQAFDAGARVIPGMRLRAVGGGGAGPTSRLPQVVLVITSILTPADSAKGLHDLRGPLGAPWWERVPWTWVTAVLVALLAILLIVRATRRRKPSPVVPVAVPRRRDPSAEALSELRALRSMQLPEHGRFAEHAFRLGQILRRFLEATVSLARPGDTTPELVAHLRGAGLIPDDVQRLTALLRVWDRVKFAREPFTVDEALRTEGAVESYVREAGTTRPGRVA